MRQDQPNNSPDVVFVLGPHRSGTSAVTRALNIAGLSLPRDLLGATAENPKGHWESKQLIRLNDEVLEAADRHWADPKPMPRGFHLAQGLQKRLDEFFRQVVQDKGGPVLLKDPRLSRTSPVIFASLARVGASAGCVLVFRRPEEVAKSLFARDRMAVGNGLDLWSTYMLEAELASRGIPRIIVGFDQLLKEGPSLVQDVIAELSLDVDDDPSRMEGLDRFLDPSLQHHVAMPEGGRDLHDRVFIAVSEGGSEMNPRLDALRDEWRSSWQRRSPGDTGSGIEQQMPSWYAEQHWRSLAEGKLEEALSWLERAANQAPDVARFHFLLGNLYSRLGRPLDGVRAHQEAVALDPESPRYHRALVRAFDELGWETPSAVQAGRLARLEPTAENLALQGERLRRIGAYGGAIRALRQAVSIKHGDGALFDRLSWVLEYAGDREEAYAAAGRAAELHDAMGPDAWERLGNLAAVSGEFERAGEAWGRALLLREKLLQASQGDQAASHRAPWLARRATRFWAASLLEALSRPRCEDPTLAWPDGQGVARRPRIPIPPEQAAEHRPILSVMIPVYEVEAEDWLRDAIDSVLAQDRGQSWAEIVVVDDASPSTVAAEVTSEYGERVSYHRNETNLGLVANHNRCIELARGEFVHILHQDDRVAPGFYESLLAPMQADPDLVAGFCHNYFSNAQGIIPAKHLPPRPSRGILSDWHVFLSLEHRIQFPSIIVRRKTYETVGGFFPGRRFSFDWDLWNRVAALGPVWYEPEPLAVFRIHAASATHSFSLRERVADAMQTAAAMVELVPSENQPIVAEMALYKFFLRYSSMLVGAAGEEFSEQHLALLELLGSDWLPEQRADRALPGFFEHMFFEHMASATETAP